FVPSISGWFGTDGQKSTPPNYAPSNFVNQIYPTLALLPRLIYGLAEPAPNAVVLKYALSSWDGPAKFGLVFVAPPTLAGWSPTVGQKSVVLKYASTTWDAPPK